MQEVAGTYKTKPVSEESDKLKFREAEAGPNGDIFLEYNYEFDAKKGLVSYTIDFPKFDINDYNFYVDLANSKLAGVGKLIEEDTSYVTKLEPYEIGSIKWRAIWFDRLYRSDRSENIRAFFIENSKGRCDISIMCGTPGRVFSLSPHEFRAQNEDTTQTITRTITIRKDTAKTENHR